MSLQVSIVHFLTESSNCLFHQWGYPNLIFSTCECNLFVRLLSPRISLIRKSMIDFLMLFILALTINAKSYSLKCSFSQPLLIIFLIFIHQCFGNLHCSWVIVDFFVNVFPFNNFFYWVMSFLWELIWFLFGCQNWVASGIAINFWVYHSLIWGHYWFFKFP